MGAKTNGVLVISFILLGFAFSLAISELLLPAAFSSEKFLLKDWTYLFNPAEAKLRDAKRQEEYEISGSTKLVPWYQIVFWTNVALMAAVPLTIIGTIVAANMAPREERFRIRDETGKLLPDGPQNWDSKSGKWTSA